MIEAHGLSRRYGSFLAVDDVSFSIGSGEVVGLLGHNGAGKTTIMKMLTGFLEPSAGQIKVDNAAISDDLISTQAKMGYLPESLPLYPELSVSEYLAYVAQLRGLEPQSCVRRAIDATQLQAKALDPIQTLSRGFKQRVGVAQAILHAPQILILDEPTNGLDPNQIQQMRQLIRDLASQATVILSTHIMQEVDAVCDRALILRNGRLVVDERLDELRRSRGVIVASDASADLAGVVGSLAGVNEVQRLGEGRWQLSVAGDSAAVCAQVAQALVAASLPIYELSQQSRDLETVFREVNDVGPQAATEAQTGDQDAA